MDGLTVKKGDFVEISFTGKVMDTGAVFDTTEESIAKEHELNYRPGEMGRKIVCVGEKHLLIGLDSALEGVEINKEQSIVLEPDQAFGSKDASLIKLIPTNHFRKEGITPEPGTQVSVDGALGVVKTVSGARTLVDLNNPLAGRNVGYTFTITKRIEDPNIQAAWIVSNELGFLPKVESQKDRADALTITIPIDLPEELKKTVTERVQKLIPKIRAVTVEKSPQNPNNKV